MLVIFFYYSISKKRYFVYKLWGYTDARIYYILNRPLYMSLFFTMLLSNLIMSGVLYKNIFSHLACEVFLTMLKLNIATTFLIVILSIPLFRLLFLLQIATEKKV